MATPRRAPYVHVTWLTKLLSEEHHCKWALWFQANHRFDRVQSNLEDWQTEHDKMVTEQAKALRAEGFTVYNEDKNSFQVKGKNGTMLSGTPDLVAIRDGKAMVIDCKTGKRSPSHEEQVLLYMRLLPMNHATYKGLKMTGRVQYQDGYSLDIGQDRLIEFDPRLRSIMGFATSTSEPARRPSPVECKYLTGCEF